MPKCEIEASKAIEQAWARLAAIDDKYIAAGFAIAAAAIIVVANLIHNIKKNRKRGG